MIFFLDRQYKCLTWSYGHYNLEKFVMLLPLREMFRIYIAEFCCVDIIWALPQTVVLIYLVLQVHGVVQDKNGKTVATLFGKWDESMHFMNGDGSGKGKGSELQLLWKRSKPPKSQTRYNFSRFAITLNELTPDIKVVVRKLLLFSSIVSSSSSSFLILFLIFFFQITPATLRRFAPPSSICW